MFIIGKPVGIYALLSYIYCPKAPTVYPNLTLLGFLMYVTEISDCIDDGSIYIFGSGVVVSLSSYEYTG